MKALFRVLLVDLKKEPDFCISGFSSSFFLLFYFIIFIIFFFLFYFIFFFRGAIEFFQTTI